MEIIKQPPNTNRLIALDILKTVAVFFMILIHVTLMYASPKAIYSDLTKMLAFTVEGKAAPAFIFAMGIAIVFASPKSPKQICWRALSLFGTGYLLNVLKFYPTINWLQVFPDEFFVETQRANNWSGLLGFLTVADILQFAGIAYLLCSFLHRWAGHLTFLGIGCCLLFFILAPILYQEQFASSNYFIKLIYGKNHQVYFPLFPWLGFAFMGLSIGSWLKSAGERLQPVMLVLGSFGITFLLLGFFLIKQDVPFYFGVDYYHRGIGALIMYSGQLLLSLAIYYLLSTVLANWLRSFFISCSRNVTRIYIVQWISIYWGLYFIPYGSQPWSKLWLYYLLFTVLSLTVAALWEKMLKGEKLKV